MFILRAVNRCRPYNVDLHVAIICRIQERRAHCIAVRIPVPWSSKPNLLPGNTSPISYKICGYRTSCISCTISTSRDQHLFIIVMNVLCSSKLAEG